MLNKKQRELKDFLYLDFERVRSFYAQMFSGETQTRTTSTNRDSSLKTKVGVKIAGLFGLEAAPSISIARGSTETKSLHHQLYIEFEEQLEKWKKVSEINTFNSTTEKPFIKIHGRIQIIDYKGLLKRLAKTFDLMDYFKKMELEKIKEQTNDKNELARLKRQVNEKYAKPKEYDDMFDMIEALYGDTLMLNVYVEDQLFAKANLSPSLFQFESSGIISGTEALIDEEWIIIGQIINEVPKPNLSTTGENKFDELFSTSMLPAYKDMKNMIETKAKNNIIPVSIYRVL